MTSNENYEVSQGSALGLQVTLKDSQGDIITSYDGAQSLTSTAWPGGQVAATFVASTVWVTPSSGLIRITISGNQTTDLAPGRYQLVTRLNDSGIWVDAYGCTIDVLPVAGQGTAPTTYTLFDDLLTYGRSWLRQLQSSDDQAGFAEQQGRARTWIEIWHVCPLPRGHDD